MLINTNTRIIQCSLVMMTFFFISAQSVVAEAGQLQTPEKPESILAAESLLSSARNLLYTPNSTAKIGRLLAISGYIADLAPDDVDVQQFLSNVYQIRKNYPAAEVATRKQLDVNPANFEIWRQWQQSRLDMLNTAPERIKFLKSIVGTRLYTSPQRSVAATELADIYIGKGAHDDAEKMLERAIKLNPLNSTALISRLEMTKDPSAKMRTETMLALLTGNPRSPWVAKQLSSYLTDHGLHKLALGYLDHSWRLIEGKNPVYLATPDFAAEYANTLLDIGLAAEAVKLFRPDIARLSSSLYFQGIMAQAFREIGDTSSANLLGEQMAKTYQSKMVSQKLALDLSASDPESKKAAAKLAAEMAWFYMTLQLKPVQAMKYANEVKKFGGDSEMTEVVLGAAELSAGQKKKGLIRLEPLTAKYPMAAVLVAGFEFQTGKKQAAKKHLLEGFAVTRTGMPYRLLSRLAKKYNVPIPPDKDAEIIKKLVDSLDPAVLKIGLNPEEFISVTCAPLKSTVKLSVPIILKATLTNIGKLPLQIGKWGLLNNRLGLAVSVGKDEDVRTFASLPVIIWSMPKILQPGNSVTGQVKLDTGVVADYLAARPLDSIILRVQGLLSPSEKGKKIVSRLPSVDPGPLTIRRMGILGSNSGSMAENYNRALRTIAQVQTEGTVSQRMTAARQVASLLQWYRDVEQEKTLLARSLKPVINKDVLLGMMSQTLRDKAPVVRAEILAALAFINLDGAILNQIGPIIDDPSPLVRFRVAELLGGSGKKGNLKMLEMFVKDKNKFVRMMARAFLRAEHEKNKLKISK